MPNIARSKKARGALAKKKGGRKKLSKKEAIRVLLDCQSRPKAGKLDDEYDLARLSLNGIVNPEDRTVPLTSEDLALFLASVSLSTTAVPGYATLDKGHIHNINNVIEQIETYVADTSKKRPLNFLMLAAPGAGKSHFIDCVAKVLRDDGVRAIKFDMTSLQRNEDLTLALDLARNEKTEDHIPLLFLDEFDSRQEHISLLLPLLWEGELILGQKTLKLGRAIIVLAGSNSALPTIMNNARGMGGTVAIPEGTNPKIVDLLSRMNGSVVQIPAFSEVIDGVDRQLDKVCVAVHLLKHRFGEELRSVPLALLRYIVHTEFRYGVRSIDHLIQQIRCKGKVVHLRIGQFTSPMDSVESLKESSLIYHLLNRDQVRGVHTVVDAWSTECEVDEQLPVNIALVASPWWPIIGKSEIADRFIRNVLEELKPHPPAQLRIGLML